MIVSSISNIAIRIASVGLLLVLNIQLARALGPENYGVLAFTMAWVQLLAILVQFGLPTALTRSTTLAVEHGETERLRSELFSSLTLMLLTWCAIVALCLALWGLVAEPRGGLELATPALLAVLILALGPVIAGVLVGLGQVVSSQLPDQIARPGLYCAALALAFLAGHALSPASALWLQVATAGMAVLAGSAILWRSLPARGTPAWIRPFQLAQGVRPFLILALVQGLSGHAAILVLGQLASDVELAHFRVAMQISDALNLVLLGISVVIGPMVTRYHSRKDWAGLQQTVIWAHRGGFLLLLPPVIILVVWAEPILTLVFGRDYAPAYQAMQILLVGKLVYALVAFSGLVLAMMEKPGLASISVMTGFAGSMLLLYPLFTAFGLVGAAFSVVFGALITNAVALVICRQLASRGLSAVALMKEAK